MRKNWWVSVFLLFTTSVIAQDVWIKIGMRNFPESEQVSVVVKKGRYVLMEHQDTLFSMNSGDTLFLVPKAGNIVVNFKNHNAEFKGLSFFGTQYVNQLNIISKGHKKTIEDNLFLVVKASKLDWINHVDLEHYIAGVIESEAGYSASEEYYKLQAILSRTYAIKNKNRHAHEGFDLCNTTHCQVYHDPASRNVMHNAAHATKDLVVVDEQLRLIQTLFHSNCGGQTCNSEDVWHSELSYLKGRIDTFCTESNHSRWQKNIDKSTFNSLSIVNVSDTVHNICQEEMRLDTNDLVLKQLIAMRKIMGLKSTFFSIESAGDTIVLYGRGYGHGVGVCQEGAMVMSERGYSYKDILHYYYTNVHVVNRRALVFFSDQ